MNSGELDLKTLRYVNTPAVGGAANTPAVRQKTTQIASRKLRWALIGLVGCARRDGPLRARHRSPASAHGASHFEPHSLVVSRSAFRFDRLVGNKALRPARQRRRKAQATRSFPIARAPSTASGVCRRVHTQPRAPSPRVANSCELPRRVAPPPTTPPRALPPVAAPFAYSEL